jgi:ferredoxin-NADP reductase
VARAAVLGRLSWRGATVVARTPATPRAALVSLDVPGWEHVPGQHLDLRLTAEDGYQATRSYSVASAPGPGPLELAVERLPGGEVSPYLVDEVEPGDSVEVRGPLGGWFVWEPPLGGPLFLAAGGSGIAPLMAIVRHRAAAGSRVPTRLLVSSRSPEETLYRDELERLAAGDAALEVVRTLTRAQPPGWDGFARRVDDELVAAVAWPAAARPLAYVCGPSGFVETVADALVRLGYEPGRVRTERFG